MQSEEESVLNVLLHSGYVVIGEFLGSVSDEQTGFANHTITNGGHLQGPGHHFAGGPVHVVCCHSASSA
jgi:hypothetical protein